MQQLSSFSSLPPTTTSTDGESTTFLDTGSANEWFNVQNAVTTTTMPPAAAAAAATTVVIPPVSSIGSVPPTSNNVNSNNNSNNNNGSSPILSKSPLELLAQGRDLLVSTIQSDQVQQRREQMRQGFQTLGARFQEEERQMRQAFPTFNFGLDGTTGGSDRNSSSGQGRQEQQQELPAATRQVREGLQKIGSRLQTWSKLYEQSQSSTSSSSSSSQDIANQLASLNERMKEEQLRRDVRRVTHEACLEQMEHHLCEFLVLHPNATYEQWIEDLHPENAYDGTLLSEYKEIDLRFYVKESDHRRLWNINHQGQPLLQVQARSCMWDDVTSGNGKNGPLDFLSHDGVGVPSSAPNVTGGGISLTAQQQQQQQPSSKSGDLIQF